jgi:hypothetical protein
MIRKNKELSHLIKNLQLMELNRKLRKESIKENFIFFRGKAYYLGGKFLEETDAVVNKGLKGKEAVEYIERELGDYMTLRYLKLIQSTS